MAENIHYVWCDENVKRPNVWHHYSETRLLYTSATSIKEAIPFESIVECNILTLHLWAIDLSCWGINNIRLIKICSKKCYSNKQVFYGSFQIPLYGHSCKWIIRDDLRFSKK